MPIDLTILGFSSSDVGDHTTWKPQNRHDVLFPLSIEVGERDKKGGNFFEVLVATPEGLRAFGEKYGQDRIPDRNLLICLNYDWKEIEARISRIVASCARDSWDESTQALGRYFRWEYEDYIVMED